jgi:hypothetical protein
MVYKFNYRLNYALPPPPPPPFSTKGSINANEPSKANNNNTK